MLAIKAGIFMLQMCQLCAIFILDLGGEEGAELCRVVLTS